MNSLKDKLKLIYGPNVTFIDYDEDRFIYTIKSADSITTYRSTDNKIVSQLSMSHAYKIFISDNYIIETKTTGFRVYTQFVNIHTKITKCNKEVVYESKEQKYIALAKFRYDNEEIFGVIETDTETLESVFVSENRMYSIGYKTINKLQNIKKLKYEFYGLYDICFQEVINIAGVIDEDRIIVGYAWYERNNMKNYTVVILGDKSNIRINGQVLKAKNKSMYIGDKIISTDVHMGKMIIWAVKGSTSNRDMEYIDNKTIEMADIVYEDNTKLRLRIEASDSEMNIEITK